MRAIAKRHFSVRDGKARFAQVTVAMLNCEEERIREPELFFGDRRVVHFTKEDHALLDSASEAVREEEAKHGVLLCVTRIHSVEVDSHPEAARLAALSAVQELLTKRQ